MKDATLSIRLSKEDKEKFQKEAARKGLSLSSLIVMVMKEYLEEIGE